MLSCQARASQPVHGKPQNKAKCKNPNRPNLAGKSECYKRAKRMSCTRQWSLTIRVGHAPSLTTERHIPLCAKRHTHGAAELQQILRRAGPLPPYCAGAGSIAGHGLYERHNAAACTQTGHADLGHALSDSKALPRGRSRRANSHPRARGQSQARPRSAASTAAAHSSNWVMRMVVIRVGICACLQAQKLTGAWCTWGFVQQTHTPLPCPAAGSREASTGMHCGAPA